MCLLLVITLRTCRGGTRYCGDWSYFSDFMKRVLDHSCVCFSAPGLGLWCLALVKFLCVDFGLIKLFMSWESAEIEHITRLGSVCKLKSLISYCHIVRASTGSEVDPTPLLPRRKSPPPPQSKFPYLELSQHLFKTTGFSTLAIFLFFDNFKISTPATTMSTPLPRGMRMVAEALIVSPQHSSNLKKLAFSPQCPGGSCP